jgi:MOSC domain-containing protein YiiM
MGRLAAIAGQDETLGPDWRAGARARVLGGGWISLGDEIRIQAK